MYKNLKKILCYFRTVEIYEKIQIYLLNFKTNSNLKFTKVYQV